MPSLRAYDPATGEWLNLKATKNVDGTATLATTAALSLPAGQAAAAASLPVVIATDQIDELQVLRVFTGNGETKTLSDGNSTQCAVFASDARGFRIVSDYDVWIEVGSNPTAAADTSTFLRANQEEYFGCAGSDRVALKRHTANSTTVRLRAVK